MTSTNFAFLAKGHDPLFLQLAEAAERTLAVDPNSTLLKVRQLGEAFAKHAAAAAGVWTGPQAGQVDLLRELDRKGYLDRQILDLFHSLRRVGNAAAHDFIGSRTQAVDGLRIARQLALWFHGTFGPPGSRGLKAGPFVPPPDPTEHLRKLEAEHAALRVQLERLAEGRHRRTRGGPARSPPPGRGGDPPPPRGGGPRRRRGAASMRPSGS
ncbi:DUF4145 domain-containing protein [Archangium gephyra]|uniref:DUF4145 domain-containing protein n=1 Tax=Archangium gephyra TaxID=48 RepID=UPI003B76EFF2